MGIPWKSTKFRHRAISRPGRQLFESENSKIQSGAPDRPGVHLQRDWSMTENSAPTTKRTVRFSDKGVVFVGRRL